MTIMPASMIMRGLALPDYHLKSERARRSTPDTVSVIRVVHGIFTGAGERFAISIRKGDLKHLKSADLNVMMARPGFAQTLMLEPNYLLNVDLEQSKPERLSIVNCLDREISNFVIYADCERGISDTEYGRISYTRIEDDGLRVEAQYTGLYGLYDTTVNWYGTDYKGKVGELLLMMGASKPDLCRVTTRFPVVDYKD